MVENYRIVVGRAEDTLRMPSVDQVILVDHNDQEIGTAEKMKAHQDGLLHRAFSILIFRNQDFCEVLLQRRHSSKYHCGDLWSNTCCSHPRPGETTLQAAQRRLPEEMGFMTPLTGRGQFIYKASFDNGLTEHELDHVFVGIADPVCIQPDPQEVSAYRWIQIPQLLAALHQNPDAFTPWLKPALDLAHPQIIQT